jgi:flagellar hook-length control protein FliK
VFTLTVPASLDFRGLAATDATIATSEGARMEIPDRDVAMQVVQSMRLQFRDGIGEAVLKLKPDHLGTVSISLRIENGAVSASVHAGVAEVRQWLESNQSMLRDSLAEQGLRLERFVVESDEKRHASSDESADRGQSRRRRSPRPRAVASDQPVFEVLA